MRFLTPEGEPRAFVIVSSARSGSNLLVGYLRQITQAACFGEILRSGFVDKTGWARLVERLDLPETARAMHESDLTAFWELVLSSGLRRRRWLGAKAFYYHRRGDPVWERFAESDHRVIHLWRDSTFDQYVSRLLAVASGEWKSSGGRGGGEESDLVVDFDPDEYVRYRDAMRTDIAATRARYDASNRYSEVEYRQLLDHGFVGAWLEGLFGERIDVAETLRRQRSRPKINYLRNPEESSRFIADSISGGFAEA
jgi:LPS sulfotransferase NodH